MARVNYVAIETRVVWLRCWHDRRNRCVSKIYQWCVLGAPIPIPIEIFEDCFVDLVVFVDLCGGQDFEPAPI